MGAAWGSAEKSNSTFGMSNSCEICPGRGTEAFDKLCLESGFGPEGQDIDECKTLPNLCENGQCINTLGKCCIRTPKMSTFLLFLNTSCKLAAPYPINTEGWGMIFFKSSALCYVLIFIAQQGLPHCS